MIAQYHGRYHDACGGLSWVPWGMFSTVRGYHDKCGVTSWVPWGMFSTMGISWGSWRVILSTVGDTQYRGGYHDAHGGYHEYSGGCSVCRDTILCNLSTVGGVSWCMWGISWVLWGCSVPKGYSNNKRFSPMVLMISPTCIMNPPWYWVSPIVLKITQTVLMISPTVLKITPHLSWYPHGNEHLPRYWTSPTVLKVFPTCIMTSPTVLKTPTVLHTRYTGC